MGTQAVISLVKDGETFIKVIAGCDGQRAEAVAKEILQYMGTTSASNELPDVDDIYDIARELKLGCEECLVVMDKDQIIYKGAEEFSKELKKNYRKTFVNPKVNARYMSVPDVERMPEYLFIIPVVE